VKKLSRKKFSVYIRKRRRTNPNVRIKDNLNRGLRYLIKGERNSPTVAKLIGGSKEELLNHIEKQFKIGMAWNNFGAIWSIDHIKCCKSFLLTCRFHQLECFNYKNLRPLFKQENQKKSFVIKKEEQLTFI
jgi:hypothetical protein